MSYVDDSDTEDVERVPANGIQQYLLGIYNDPEFGELKGSVVSQILLPHTENFLGMHTLSEHWKFSFSQGFSISHGILHTFSIQNKLWLHSEWFEQDSPSDEGGREEQLGKMSRIEDR